MRAPLCRQALAHTYRALRPALFALPPERAHTLTLAALRTLCALPGVAEALCRGLGVPDRPVTLMGLTFPRPVGLAAGLDKDGRYLDVWRALGFGWVEVGTVTARPQPGNPRPRLFRFTTDEALVNRMGFNNAGVSALCERLRRYRKRPVLGINIGKNRDVALADAASDYVRAFTVVAPWADYVAVNVSSPNTPGLRALQETTALVALLRALREARDQASRELGRVVPIALKLAPDLDGHALAGLADLCLGEGVDGLIATNTTVSRPGGVGVGVEGGLSGRPLGPLALAAVAHLAERLQGRLPVIAVGGIFDAGDLQAAFRAGANAVQLYTGLIYRGPTVVADLLSGINPL